MKKNKKGVDLTLNTIIVAVLVVLVLIVVVTFFFGSFKGITDRVKGTFFQTTAGTDRVLAIQTCEQYCGQAQLLSTSQQLRSAYCTQAFRIDGETKLENNQYKYMFKCGGRSFPDVNKFKSDGSFRDLGVSCPEIPNCGTPN